MGLVEGVKPESSVCDDHSEGTSTASAQCPAEFSVMAVCAREISPGREQDQCILRKAEVVFYRA
jgi:hypothetical protein